MRGERHAVREQNVVLDHELIDGVIGDIAVCRHLIGRRVHDLAVVKGDDGLIGPIRDVQTVRIRPEHADLRLTDDVRIVLRSREEGVKDLVKRARADLQRASLVELRRIAALLFAGGASRKDRQRHRSCDPDCGKPHPLFVHNSYPPVSSCINYRGSFRCPYMINESSVSSPVNVALPVTVLVSEPASSTQLPITEL